MFSVNAGESSKVFQLGVGKYMIKISLQDYQSGSIKLYRLEQEMRGQERFLKGHLAVRVDNIEFIYLSSGINNEEVVKRIIRYCFTILKHCKCFNYLLKLCAFISLVLFIFYFLSLKCLFSTSSSGEILLILLETAHIFLFLEAFFDSV